MIIGIDASRTIVEKRTGTEVYALFLIQALVPLALSRDHTIRLYFNAPPSPQLAAAFPEKVEQVVIPFPRLWTHVRLAAALHRESPDVFFTPAHVIPFTYHGASVATVHDLGFHLYPEAHLWTQRVYLRWSTRHNAGRARSLLVDSQATASDLTRFYGTPPGKITVVYPGVEPGLQPVTNAAALARVQAQYGLQSPYLLYLGTLQPRKNLIRLVEAYAGIPRPRPQLVLAGQTGWLADSLLAYIQELDPSVGEGIRLPGFVAAPDKAAVISGATALLYPSLYEGFGFPILEAQACGTPVLTTTSSSLPEVAGDAALLVPAEDADAIKTGIERLLTDAALRHDLVRRGQANAQRFTWEQAARQALDVLERTGRKQS
jgi:glycosyltransferase involved in cell wall biosynthesis